MQIQAVLVAATLAMSATGAMAFSTTLVGTHIFVEYETTDDFGFGLPSLNGDQVSFAPFDLRAQRSIGVSQRFSQFLLRIYARNGFDLLSLSYAAGGTYTKVGSGLVSATGLFQLNRVVYPGLLIGGVNFSTDALPAALDSAWTASSESIAVGSSRSVVDVYVGETLKALGLSNSLNRIVNTWSTLAVAVVPSVPEPETYAMMLAGVAVIAFIARRRRST